MKPIFKRSKSQVILHIVRNLLEVRKRFSKKDCTNIISRVLHHQNLDKHTKNIWFRDHNVSEEIVESMMSSLNSVKGIERADKFVAKRSTLHMVVCSHLTTSCEVIK